MQYKIGGACCIGIKMVTERFYMCYTADLKLARAWPNGTWDDASAVLTAYACGIYTLIFPQ